MITFHDEPLISVESSGGGTGGGLGGLSPPNEKSGGAKGMFSPPQYLPSAPRSGDRWENFEVGAEHILDREVPFPAIWGVCKAKKFICTLRANRWWRSA